MRALTMEQRLEHCRALERACAHRYKARQAEQEAAAILDGKQWWCSPTTQDTWHRAELNEDHTMKMLQLHSKYTFHENDPNITRTVLVRKRKKLKVTIG